MSDKKNVKQTPEQREALREMARRFEDASDRLAAHDIAFTVSYKRNVPQEDGSLADGLAITRHLSGECAIMEMLADWHDAKKAAMEGGDMSRFMGEVLALQEGKAD